MLENRPGIPIDFAGADVVRGTTERSLISGYLTLALLLLSSALDPVSETRGSRTFDGRTAKSLRHKACCIHTDTLNRSHSAPSPSPIMSPEDFKCLTPVSVRWRYSPRPGRLWLSDAHCIGNGGGVLFKVCWTKCTAPPPAGTLNDNFYDSS